MFRANDEGVCNLATTGRADHNHPYDHSIDGANENCVDRYPSGRDWQALDVLVRGGANAATLSIFILDPFGDLREFRYSDRALYDFGMSRQQRLDGDNLPPETQGCS